MPGYAKTKEQHKLNGTYRPTRHEKKPIGSELSHYEPTFTLDEYGERFFYKVTAELNNKGVLQSEDLTSLTHLAAHASIVRNMFQELQTKGLIAEGSTGNKVPAPEYTIFQKASKDFADHCVKLGIGALARVKLHLEDRIPENKPKGVNLD